MNNVVYADKELISTSRAAELSEYSQDYIGQLCRSGALVCKRISNQWYVKPDSLVSFVPSVASKIKTAFQIDNIKTDEKNVSSGIDSNSDIPTNNKTSPYSVKIGDVRTGAFSIDNREFIPTQKAAEISGYSQDYIGQLARNSEVSARKIGRRWFIDKSALMKHKEEKDAMLRALQAETAGIPDEDRTVQLNINKKFPKSALNYTNFNISYEADDSEILIPKGLNNEIFSHKSDLINGSESDSSSSNDTLFVGTNKFRKRFAEIVNNDTYTNTLNNSALSLGVETGNVPEKRTNYDTVFKSRTRQNQAVLSPVRQAKVGLSFTSLAVAMIFAVVLGYFTVLFMPNTQVSKINKTAQQLASAVYTSDIFSGVKSVLEEKYGDKIPGRTVYYTAD